MMNMSPTSHTNIEIQIWLQKKFQLGIPLAWGCWYCPIIPHPVPVVVEVPCLVFTL